MDESRKPLAGPRPIELKRIPVIRVTRAAWQSVDIRWRAAANERLCLICRLCRPLCMHTVVKIFYLIEFKMDVDIRSNLGRYLGRAAVL